MGRLIVDKERCVACRNCVVACAVDRHSLGKTMYSALKELEPPVPRVFITGNERESMPVQCRHCDPAPCMLACPSGAMSRDGEGRVVYNQARCLKCFMCAATCPFGVCAIAADHESVIKCDLCPNREVPACADACPTGALTYEE